jgi:hypothetical protein
MLCVGINKGAIKTNNEDERFHICLICLGYATIWPITLLMAIGWGIANKDKAK